MFVKYEARLMAAVAALIVSSMSASAASIQGHVEAAGTAVSGASVTLWAASMSAPQQVAQVRSDNNGLPRTNRPATTRRSVSFRSLAPPRPARSR
jgi:hypothetical protein